MFEDDIASRAQQGDPHPFAQERFAGTRVLVVNRNFGCGSSREHAPQALQRWGIAAVVGESFSEIFFGNSLAIGLPCVTAAPEDLEWLQARAEQDPSSTVSLDLATATLQAGEKRIAVVGARLCDRGIRHRRMGRHRPAAGGRRRGESDRRPAPIRQRVLTRRGSRLPARRVHAAREPLARGRAVSVAPAGASRAARHPRDGISRQFAARGEPIAPLPPAGGRAVGTAAGHAGRRPVAGPRVRPVAAPVRR